MNNSKDTVLIALIAAGVAVFATEVLRRFNTSDKLKGKKKLAPIPESMFGRKLLEEEFAVKPNYVYGNCGSFGHVPQRVILAQLELIKERESDPEGWYRFGREYSLYFDAIRELADFVKSDPANLVLVENASTGTNTALRSIEFADGDKILVNSHTYGAVLKNVKAVRSEFPGVEEVNFDLQVPLNSKADIIKQFETAINENKGIKVAIIDHITSPSALLLPIKELIEVCHKNGIIAIIDGAHAPGHIPLNLEELNADYYTGNIHKWLFAPRGCALLWVHPRHHDATRPILVSHNHMLDTLEKRFVPSATRDSTAYLAVPSAIAFHKALGGLDVLLERNRQLANAAAEMLAEAWGVERYPVPESLRSPNMALIALPPIFQDNFPPEERECTKLMKRLHDKGSFISFNPVSGKIWARISVHAWNSMEDFFEIRDKVLEMVNEVPSIVQMDYL
ncbi:uncharacterized protein [Apostichopus japonicus]|uniref:uncharacterized protein n=1 Tax=Stichopus japonicus TaxID=307972 RepID=UPI003AB4E595